VGNGYKLDPATMTTVAQQLADASSTLTGQHDALAVHPDAGQSSNDVSKAFDALATAMTALAKTLQDVSGNVTDAVTAYQTSDQQVQHHFTATGAR
jgi:uncharacterized protein YukE